MYCFYKKTHSNEHNESVWDNEWEGQVVLRHISTTCGGGAPVLQVFYPYVSGGEACNQREMSVSKSMF